MEDFDTAWTVLPSIQNFRKILSDNFHYIIEFCSHNPKSSNIKNNPDRNYQQNQLKEIQKYRLKLTITK